MGMKVYDLQHELQQTCAVFGRQKETNLIFEGTEAYTDGKNIVIPSMPEEATISDANARILRGYVDHEAGHIRHTDFKFFLDVVERGITQKLHGLWNSVEDVMLEERVIAEYPGSEKNLKELTNNLNLKEIEHIQKTGGGTIINADTLSCCMRSYGRDRHVLSSSFELQGLFSPEIQKWARYFADRAKVSSGTKESFAIACDMAKILKDDPELKSDPPSVDKGLDGKPSDAGNPEDGKDGKALADSVGEGAEAKTKGEAEAEVYGKGKPKNTKSKDKMDPIKDIAKDIAGGSGLTFDYHGKNGEKPYKVVSTRGDETIRRNGPTPRGGQRIHSAMKSASPASYDRIKNNIGGQVNTMKSRLRRSLAAMEQRDWDSGRLVGKLDSKRLVAATQGSQNVFKKRHDRLELDTSVHMLLDLSGSMSGEKMKVAADCAIAFAECLEGSPIRYQVSGFSNSGSDSSAKGDIPYYSRIENMQTYIFKDFNESLHAAKGAMSVLPQAAGGHNSDRDAILWAYKQLVNQPTKRKVLMVFSDGQPANATHNVGYDHLNFHTAEIVKSLEQKKGVEIIGIGIHTNHLKQFYSNFVEITNLSDLSGAMFNKLANALVKGRVQL